MTNPLIEIFFDSPDSLQYVNKITPFADIIAIGKSCVDNTEQSVSLIRGFKQSFPAKKLLIEIVNKKEAELYYRAGADICALSRSIGKQNISDIIKIAKTFNAKVQIDILATDDKIRIAKESAKFGIKIISMPSRKTLPIANEAILNDIKNIVKEKLPIDISVVSDFKMTTMQKLCQAGVNIVKIHSNTIFSSSDSNSYLNTIINNSTASFLTKTANKSYQLYNIGSLSPVIDSKKLLDLLADMDKSHANDEIETIPSKSALFIKLSGDKTKGKAIEQSSTCFLKVVFDLMENIDNSTLVKAFGEILSKAYEAKLEVVFKLYGREFKVKDNKNKIATKFNDKGFENPIEFTLIAPSLPQTSSYQNFIVYLEMEIYGYPALDIPIELTIVNNIGIIPKQISKNISPRTIDLNKLLETWKTSGSADATLTINCADDYSAVFYNHESGQEIQCNSNALSQLSIADKCMAIAKKLNLVGGDPIWCYIEDPLNPTVTEQETLSCALRQVAVAGWQLYNWFATVCGMQDIFNKINKLPPNSLIRVRTDNILIPWEIMYPQEIFDDDNQVVDSTLFWGYQYRFESYITPAIHNLPGFDSSDLIKTQINSVRNLTAVLNTDIDKEAIAQKWKFNQPVLYQQSILKQLIEYDAYSDLDCSSVKEIIRETPAKTSTSTFIYFYCHGSSSYALNSNTADLLKINNNCQIKLSDFSDKKTFENAPIVFLNSCSSGNLISVSFDSFSEHFLNKGALGLITTSFTVPGPYAAKFGCELIRRYLNREDSLGNVLLRLKRDALDHKNPIGLFYVLQCPSNIRLES